MSHLEGKKSKMPNNINLGKSKFISHIGFNILNAPTTIIKSNPNK